MALYDNLKVDCMFLLGECHNITDLLDTGDHKNIGRDMIGGQIILFSSVFSSTETECFLS